MLEHLHQQDVTSRLELVLVDRGVTETAARTIGKAHDIEVRRVGWDDKQPDFQPIRQAWRVEVAHGRLGRCRRLAKSFENTAASASGWLQLASIATTLRHPVTRTGSPGRRHRRRVTTSTTGGVPAMNEPSTCQCSSVDEWGQLRARLTAAGVSGAEDLGRFVSNPEILGETRLDERAAMPVLVEALPSLTDRALVGAVAGHLRRPWARPAAFDALLASFEEWAERDPLATGWHLGDALGTAATAVQVETLLRLSRSNQYRTARQMVVHSLGRFKKALDVPETLVDLIEDPDVALHAMQALRRVIGAQQALPHLERVEREHRGTQVGDQAAREAKKARKSLL